jgi:hypothetical protein
MRKHLFLPLALFLGFGSLMAQSSVTLNVNQPPLASVDAGNDTMVFASSLVVLQGSATGGTAPLSYLWSPALNMPDPTVLNPPVNVTQPTVFTLTVTDANNCVTKDSVFVDVMFSTESFTPAMFKMYPNPATDQLTIEHPLKGSFQLTLSNVLGQTVLTKTDPGTTDRLSLNVGNLPAGPYMLKIQQGNRQVSLKVVIQ